MTVAILARPALVGTAAGAPDFDQLGNGSRFGRGYSSVGIRCYSVSRNGFARYNFGRGFDRGLRRG
jgi:hypothetical protein